MVGDFENGLAGGVPAVEDLIRKTFGSHRLQPGRQSNGAGPSSGPLKQRHEVRISTSVGRESCRLRAVSLDIVLCKQSFVLCTAEACIAEAYPAAFPSMVQSCLLQNNSSCTIDRGSVITMRDPCFCEDSNVYA